MHGWCPERENGGKGGPGHGKIGAKVVGDGFLPIADSFGTQSRTKFEFFGTSFG